MEEFDRRGIKYNYQHKVFGGFSVDFAFPEQKIAVECDGDYWHGNPAKYQGKLNSIQKKNSEVDRKRMRIIEASGWKIIRFWEHQIKKDVKICVDLIEENLKEKD
jgi:very-short-patch-repair endonuclease